MITITQTVNVSLSIKKDEMKKGLVIERVGMNKLDNAQHVQLHSALYAIMAEFDLTKIGIPEEATMEWDGSLHLEKDLNIETTASATSKLLKKKDEARTRLALFIFSQVRSFLLSPETDEVEAAERLYVVTKGYAGIQQESQDRETAHIDGLVEDLKKTEHAADMTKLRLTSARSLRSCIFSARKSVRRKSCRLQRRCVPKWTNILNVSWTYSSQTTSLARLLSSRH